MPAARDLAAGQSPYKLSTRDHLPPPATPGSVADDTPSTTPRNPNPLSYLGYAAPKADSPRHSAAATPVVSPRHTTPRGLTPRPNTNPTETAHESHIIDDPYIQAPAASPRPASPEAPADSPRRSPRGLASRVASARNRAHERAHEKEEHALADDSQHADRAQISPRQLSSPHLTPREKASQSGQVPEVHEAAVRGGVKTDLLKFAVSFDVKFFPDSSCVITQV